MKSLQWKVPLAVLLLTGLLLPFLKGAIDAAELKIAAAKKRLVFSEDLSQNYQYYADSQNELKAKGVTLWGSGEIGDFLAELEKVSKEAKIPILNTKPYGVGEMGNRDSIGVQLEITGSTTGIVKFIYEVLNLPGLIAVEKLNLREEGTQEGELLAQVVISRAVYNRKGSGFVL